MGIYYPKKGNCWKKWDQFYFNAGLQTQILPGYVKCENVLRTSRWTQGRNSDRRKHTTRLLCCYWCFMTVRQMPTDRFKMHFKLSW